MSVVLPPLKIFLGAAMIFICTKFYTLPVALSNNCSCDISIPKQAEEGKRRRISRQIMIGSSTLVVENVSVKIRNANPPTIIGWQIKTFLRLSYTL